MTLDKMPVEETTYGENGMLPKFICPKNVLRTKKKKFGC
jgi:hypothetical protein